MRITDVIIRAQVNGKWDNFDLGDPRLPNEQIIEWLHKQGDQRGQPFFDRLVLILLNRKIE